MNMSLIQSENPKADATQESNHTNIGANDLSDVVFGNVVNKTITIDPSNSNTTRRWGDANCFTIGMNINNIKNAVNKDGFTLEKSILSVWIHELGHNLGLVHEDKFGSKAKGTYIMLNPDINRIETDGPRYPEVDSDGMRILIENMNKDIRWNADEGTPAGRIHQKF